MASLTAIEIPSPVGPLPYIPDDLTLPQFLFDCQHPSRPQPKGPVPWFIEDGTGRKIMESEVRTRVSDLANGLHLKYGLTGDVFSLIIGFLTDYPIAIWATHRLGELYRTTGGANPEFSKSELVYQLEATKAALVIAHPDSLEVALSAASEAGLSSDRLILFDARDGPENKSFHTTVNDLIELGSKSPQSFVELRLKPGEGKSKVAFLNFSSGTTGRPKAVAIPHIAPIANVIQLAAHNKVNEDYCPWEDRRFRPGDTAIGVLPFYHIYGLVVNLHFVLFNGMSLVVVPKFNFVGMLKSIVRYRISHLFLVPPHIVLLCKHPAVKDYDLRPHIRMIMCGAAPLSHELNQQLFEMFPEAHIGQGYGMTETCTVATMWSIAQKRGISGSSGQLVPGCVARVMKSDGKFAGYNEVGELIVKSPSAALEYAGNEQATRETFLGDGWVRTGDEVRIDSDAEVWVLDRIKEIMKVKGFQVAPAELEGCILEHRDVSDACVVGVPDDYSGEVPMAFVVLTHEAQKRVIMDHKEAPAIKLSVMKHVADNKVAYKQLKGGVEFVSTIPTSPSGKLLRRVLRDKAREMKRIAKL
ncbi:phenylacetyl-CoA ligase [Cyathus striatus]|nr:phenylacetyl-CoA ligase [Cyathus striatus]